MITQGVGWIFFIGVVLSRVYMNFYESGPAE
jgi:hypothetical protein